LRVVDVVFSGEGKAEKRIRFLDLMDFDCSRRFANRQSCLQPYIYIFYVLDESILQPASATDACSLHCWSKSSLISVIKANLGKPSKDFYRVQGLWKRKSVLPYFLEQRISHALLSRFMRL
jgi:hypothetical protein